MRAATLSIAAATAALLLTAAPSPVRAQSSEAPAPVPGPLRPMADPAPVFDPPGTRRPAGVQPAEPPRPTARLDAPTPPPMAEAYEGAFRPGATGEKAGGRAVARPAAKELKLEKLAVTPGRDLELWLVAIDRIGNGEDLSDTKRVSLGRLKKPEGDQTYRLPPEIDLRVYRAVVVWSRRERSARAGALLMPQAVQKPVKTKKGRKG